MPMMESASPYFMPTNYMKPEPQDFYPCDTQPLGGYNMPMPIQDVVPTDIKPVRKRGRKKANNGDASPLKSPKIKQEKVTNSLHVRKKRDRFNGMPEDEVMARVLPDHIRKGLDMVIVGINPGLMAAYVGHHYAGPGNHFWKCLYLSGLTPEPMTAYDDFKMLDIGIGFTNIVSRTTRGSADLTRKEIKDGAEILLEKIKAYQPKIAVFNGKGIYEVFCGHKNFYIGKQPEKLPDTDTVVYVMPSSSARCSQLPRAIDKVPFYTSLKKLRDYLIGETTELDDSEVCFPDLELKVKVKSEKTDEQHHEQQQKQLQSQQQSQTHMPMGMVPYVKQEPTYEHSSYGIMSPSQMQPYPGSAGSMSTQSTHCWNGNSSVGSAFNPPSVTNQMMYNNGPSQNFNNGPHSIKQEIDNYGQYNNQCNSSVFNNSQSGHTDQHMTQSAFSSSQHSPLNNSTLSPSNIAVTQCNSSFNSHSTGSSPKPANASCGNGSHHSPAPSPASNQLHTQSPPLSRSALNPQQSPLSSPANHRVSSPYSVQTPPNSNTGNNGNNLVSTTTSSASVMVKPEPGTFSQGCTSGFHHNNAEQSQSNSSAHSQFLSHFTSQYQNSIIGYPSYGQYPGFPPQQPYMYPPNGPISTQNHQFPPSTQSFMAGHPSQQGFNISGGFPPYPTYPQGPI